MKAKWKDETGPGYDNNEIVGSEIKVGIFALSIHRHIYYPKDQWLASCGYIFNLFKLKSEDLGEAKCQAKAHLQVILQDAIDDIVKKG